ncbi:hypothetical protein ACOSP7_003045 [Xanthoceras sorbifolium]
MEKLHLRGGALPEDLHLLGWMVEEADGTRAADEKKMKQRVVKRCSTAMAESEMEIESGSFVEKNLEWEHS